MKKIKRALSAVARGLIRIILYAILAPAFILAKLCEFLEPIFDDVERKMGW